MTLLVTCARAPVSIEWIRIAQRSNHKVILVDSLDDPIGAFYPQALYKKVPSPKNNFEAYKQEMLELFTDIDMVIPNCEDIFYLSQIRHSAPSHVSFLMPEHDMLFTLHHKFDFFSLVNAHVNIPQSKLITSKNQIVTDQESILKPVYSRFGRDIIYGHDTKSIERLTIAKHNPWVQQQFIRGEPLCSYAVCCEGEVVSQVVYRPKYLLNGAASTYFEYSEDRRCEAFVIQFAKENNYHGQVAFDFIDDGEELYVIECNPRATSGLHLISEGIKIQDNGTIVSDKLPIKKSYRIGVVLYLFFGVKALLKGKALTLYKEFKRADDALRGLPFYAQFFSLYEMIKRAIRYKKALTTASTFDIEYNGEKAR